MTKQTKQMAQLQKHSSLQLSKTKQEDTMNLKRKKLKKKKSRFATLKPTHMEQGSEDSSQSQVSIKKVKKLKMKKLKTFTSS